MTTRALRLELSERNGTRFPAPALQTRTVVVVDAVPTSPAVSARKRRAFIDIYATVFAGEAGSAAAFVVIVENQAFSTVCAGLGEAEVDASFAAGAEEAGGALAALPVHEVHAGAPVFAGNAGTIVDVDFTAVSAEAVSAGAPEAISGSGARGSVATRSSGARVGF